MEIVLNGIIIVIGIMICLGMLGWCLWLQRKNKRLQMALVKSEEREKAAKKGDMLKRAMLPTQLLELFQKDESEEMRLGVEKKLHAAILSFNIPDFSRMIRSYNAKEIFGFVNGVLSRVVPAVLFQEGEVDKFSEAGLTAFFLETPENALRSAISICESVNEQENKQLKYSIGLAYGEVMVGMVGHEKRYGVLTISETTGFAEFLQEIGGRYGVRILLTGSMKKQIPNFEQRYHYRYLGNVFLNASGMEEELYEVYDGDDQADKNGKRKTKPLFEKGVALYQERNFYDARLHFIEVLKANRMDGVARRYLYLSDQYKDKNKEDTADMNVSFEVY